jgi:hypothetical protein
MRDAVAHLARTDHADLLDHHRHLILFERSLLSELGQRFG